MEKYLIFTLFILTSFAVINNKVVWTVNLDDINTIFTTEIDIYNNEDASPKPSILKSYNIALNASQEENLVNL